jgi:hypothetical protein
MHHSYLHQQTLALPNNVSKLAEGTFEENGLEGAQVEIFVIIKRLVRLRIDSEEGQLSLPQLNASR